MSPLVKDLRTFYTQSNQNIPFFKGSVGSRLFYLVVFGCWILCHIPWLRTSNVVKARGEVFHETRPLSENLPSHPIEKTNSQRRFL